MFILNRGFLLRDSPLEDYVSFSITLIFCLYPLLLLFMLSTCFGARLCIWWTMRNCCLWLLSYNWSNSKSRIKYLLNSLIFCFSIYKFLSESDKNYFRGRLNYIYCGWGFTDTSSNKMSYLTYFLFVRVSADVFCF
mgnify:FL=1